MSWGRIGKWIFAVGFLYGLSAVAAAKGQGIGKSDTFHVEKGTDSSKVSELQQVVVIGMFEPGGLQKSLYRIRVIDKKAIERRHGTDLLDVLRTMTGVRMSTDQTLGETDISLLGMAGENIKILLDGVPLLDRGATRNSLSQIDLHSIERIEIVEGPLSVMYGADALAGVINIITKSTSLTISQVKEPKLGHFGAEINLLEQTAGNEYQPFDKDGVHNGNLGLNWRKGKIFADASLTRNNFGGWTAEENKGSRTKDWLPKEQWLAGARVGFQDKKWSGWYRFQYLQEDIWSLGAENPNTLQATDKEYLTDRSTHQMNLNWTPEKSWRFNMDGSYQLYSRRTRTTTYNTETGVRNLIPDPDLQEKSDFNSGFIRLTGHHKFNEKLEGLIGLELTHEKGSGPRIEGEPTIDNYSLFVSGDYKPFSWLAVRPGLRFSKNSIYDAPPVIPALNAKINLGHDLALRLSYARGFRAPALRELYFWFFDANHSIKGNENLKAEYAHAYSASVSWLHLPASGLQASADWNFFYNDYRNRIEMALDPSLGTNVYSYINLAKYKTLGTSLNAQLQSGGFHAGLGFAYVAKYNTYYADQTYASSNLPEFVWSPELSADLSYVFTKSQLELGLQYKFTGALSQYEIDEIDGEQRPFLAKTGSFNWLDFSASVPVIKALKLSAGVKNIFNVTNLNNTSMGGEVAHSTGGPLPLSYGRSYFIGINWRWP
ncbi:outer membrane receptor for ferrienterochelin and colicins [Arachidicoccus rhizosphaerae]|uniref:Outer membrane receptor for ferrienterochelin and colicins n=1 Tax=Arachidicoccus rhizosphaerae TaxID=551991 RepID=A0A1H3X7I7_9BACT|nr:TonB-dependent receptor [Arachidicoccus rhizosphaerae]SDZ95346.1 outer membrane receptor for ferrienterochelin and colicins [Arachidicoccus rhizosphaerae]